MPSRRKSRIQDTISCSSRICRSSLPTHHIPAYSLLNPELFVLFLPSTGALRYNLPVPPLRTSTRLQNATEYGASCFQHADTSDSPLTTLSATATGIVGEIMVLLNKILSQQVQSPFYITSSRDSEDCKLPRDSRLKLVFDCAKGANLFYCMR